MRIAAAATAALVLGAAGASADEATLVVRMEGIEREVGELRVAVCATAFEETGCPWGGFRRAASDSAEFVFEGIPQGRYAVAGYHDVNGNGELDMIPPGIPREPYAFSNDIGRLRPPTFDDALVEVGPGKTVVVLNVRGLFG